MRFKTQIFFLIFNMAILPSILTQDVYEPTKITISDAPYIVLIHTEKEFLCSGTIIAKRSVVTAADCIDNFTTESLSIKAGCSMVEPNNFQCGQKTKAKNIRISEDLGINKIAVIELENPLVYNDYVKNISLISETELKEAQSGENIAFSAGWVSSVSAFPYLEKTNIKMLEGRECLRNYRFYLTPEEYFHYDIDLHFCFDKMKNSSIARYKGSPLIVNEKFAGIQILNGNSYSSHNSLYLKLTHFEDFLTEFIDIEEYLTTTDFPSTLINVPETSTHFSSEQMYSTTKEPPSNLAPFPSQQQLDLEDKILTLVENAFKLTLDKYFNSLSSLIPTFLNELFVSPAISNIIFPTSLPAFDITFVLERLETESSEYPILNTIFLINYFEEPVLNINITSQCIHTKSFENDELIQLIKINYNVLILNKIKDGFFYLNLEDIKEILNDVYIVYVKRGSNIQRTGSVDKQWRNMFHFPEPYWTGLYDLESEFSESKYKTFNSDSINSESYESDHPHNYPAFNFKLNCQLFIGTNIPHDVDYTYFSGTQFALGIKFSEELNELLLTENEYNK